MSPDDVHYAESVEDEEEDELDYDDEHEEEEEAFSPLNFAKRSSFLMAIGPVRKFVEWMDDEKTEPDAYLAMLLTLVFLVAVVIGLASTVVEI